MFFQKAAKSKNNQMKFKIIFRNTHRLDLPQKLNPCH